MQHFRVSSLFKKQSGSATIELALILPILVFLTVLIVDLGRMTYQYNVLLKGVRQAARYLSTVKPGKLEQDPGGGGTTWNVATNMVISYSNSLCPGASSPCLSSNMVKITDALQDTDGGVALSSVSFGSGTQSMVKVRIVGYSLPSVFSELVKQWTGSTSLFSPTVAATFPQL